MAKFKHANSSQGLFMTMNMEEQLSPNTFEWAVDQLVDMMDLSVFEQNYNNDEKSADAIPSCSTFESNFVLYITAVKYLQEK